MSIMNKLPQHHSTQFASSGMALVRIDLACSTHSPIAYDHQDDYYIFVLLESGSGCGMVDFQEQQLGAGDLCIIQPGQVHRFVSSVDTRGWMLFVDSQFLGDEEKLVLDRFALQASKVTVEAEGREEKQQMLLLLHGRLNSTLCQRGHAVSGRLAEAFVTMVAEAIQQTCHGGLRHSRRQVEILLKLRCLLNEHLHASHRPSFYASRLNISTVYLNEVVKQMTGMSTALYIKNEIVLQAKRRLVHTDFPINQLAYQLGFDDQAYFSRLFTQTVGITPSQFRSKYLGLCK